MESIGVSEVDITIRSEDNLKQYISKKIETHAFQYLIEKGITLSKTRHEIYKDMKGSNYFRDKRFTPDLCSLVFCFRTRSYGVRNNFRNHYKDQSLICTLCEDDIDQQSHIFKCATIRRSLANIDENQYEDLFSEDIDKIYRAAIQTKQIVELREVLLNP